MTQLNSVHICVSAGRSSVIPNQCSLRFVSELERGKAGANLRQTLQIANSLGVDLILRERGDGSWH